MKTRPQPHWFSLERHATELDARGWLDALRQRAEKHDAFLALASLIASLEERRAATGWHAEVLR